MDYRCDRQAENIRAGLPPQPEFLCTCSFERGEPRLVGNIGSGQRFVIPICPGGEVKGPRLRGTTLPDSSIVDLVRPDGTFEFQARLLLEMSDGPLIVLCAQGQVWIPEDVARALADGAPYDPASACGESYIHFEVALDGPYAWLRRGLYFGRSITQDNLRVVTVWRI